MRAEGGRRSGTVGVRLIISRRPPKVERWSLPGAGREEQCGRMAARDDRLSYATTAWWTKYTRRPRRPRESERPKAASVVHRERSERVRARA